MGLGLLDGTQLWSNFDFGKFGQVSVSPTKGIAAGYSNTSSTAIAPVRAVTYTPQGVGAQRSIVSTSANDSAAGTGARTVTISYLDTNFVLQQETVTLNGLTAVNTVATNIAFIESMLVVTCGSNGGNVGTINLKVGTAGGGATWASIAPSDVQTFWAQHYVPAGLTCYILGIYGGSTVTAGAFNLVHTGNPLSATIPQSNLGGFYPHGTSEVFVTFQLPIPVVGPDFIFVSEHPAAVTASTTYVTFEYAQF